MIARGAPSRICAHELQTPAGAQLNLGRFPDE